MVIKIESKVGSVVLVRKIAKGRSQIRLINYRFTGINLTNDLLKS